MATSVSLTKLMRQSLILARSRGYDVFNALDIMDNEPIFDELKFGIGDGNLQYYLYNWQLSRRMLRPKELGVVLL